MSESPRDLSRKRFGVSAASYTTSRPHADRHELGHLVDIVSPEPHWIVLDVATGAGHTAAAFAPHVARTVASDLTPEMLAQAGRLLSTRGIDAALVLADAQQLPFRDRAFHLVTCRIAAHHFTDPAAFVAQAARLVPTDGTLLVQDQGVPEDRVTAQAVDAFERLRDPSHNRILSEAEWRGLLERAGFEITHLQWRTKRHRFREWIRTQRCSQGTVAALVAMATKADSAVRSWLQLEDLAAPKATFINRHLVLVGRRSGARSAGRA